MSAAPNLTLRVPQPGDAVFTALADPADRLGWHEGEVAGGDAAGGRLYAPLLAIGAPLPLGPFLYTVETGVDERHEEELNAWYDSDHLPRLAAVPGVIGAARFRLLRGEAQRYLAAYRLEAPEVFESPAWLAARDTPWTPRARGFFRNPRRAMRRLETP